MKGHRLEMIVASTGLAQRIGQPHLDPLRALILCPMGTLSPCGMPSVLRPSGGAFKGEL